MPCPYPKLLIQNLHKICGFAGRRWDFDLPYQFCCGCDGEISIALNKSSFCSNRVASEDRDLLLKQHLTKIIDYCA